VWQACNNFTGDVGVSLRRSENTKTRRGKKRGDELPSGRRAPRTSHNARVGCHSQKLLQNRPSRIPSVGACSLSVNLDRAHETATQCQPRMPTRWYQRPALPPLHGVIESLSVGDIDECATAVKGRQRRDFPSTSRGAEQQAQRSLDHFGHSSALACSLSLELCQHRLIDVEGRFHTGTHIIVWLYGSRVRVPYRGSQI
jgi:hypothetical protein